MRWSPILRSTAAAALMAAAVVLPGPPASAASCASGSGVSVVVDFHELGGGVRTACVPDGGGDAASSLFPAAGFALSYVQRQPGFVCRVSGAPADDPCVNTPPSDAYWALFWSDGRSGSWTYSTTGIGGLHVPEGGYVALSWQGSSSRSLPGATPSPHPTATPAPTTQPTTQPTAHPTRHASGHASSGSSSAAATPDAPTDSATPSGSAAPRTDRGKHRHHAGSSAGPTATSDGSGSAELSATASATADDAVPASSDPAQPDDGGLPGWVGPAVVVLLFGGAAAVAVVRRRRGTS